MRVLVIRLSSMGDVVQTLPAITDAKKANPNLQVDWVVDQAFHEIPSWNPVVQNTFASPPRQFSNLQTPEFKSFLRRLRANRYDFIIDLQGHWKSAIASRLAAGFHAGYTGDSVNEWGAHTLYRKRFRVAKNMHSIARMRMLMAACLGYSVPGSELDYGIERSRLPESIFPLVRPYAVFIHSTSWDSKNWAEHNWITLKEKVVRSGLDVVLPWGSDSERQRAERIAGADANAHVLPQLSISGKAAVIANAAVTVGLDTGLSHIAAALGVPSVTLYGATDPLLTGALGENQLHLASNFECVKCHQSVCDYSSHERPACFQELTPAVVWNSLQNVLQGKLR